MYTSLIIIIISGWLGVWHNVSLYIHVSGCKSLEVTAVSTHSHLACHVGHSLKIRINFQFMIRNNVFCYLTASEIGFNKRGFLIRGGEATNTNFTVLHLTLLGNEFTPFQINMYKCIVIQLTLKVHHKIKDPSVDQN
jgi:hypothetical protein